MNDAPGSPTRPRSAIQTFDQDFAVLHAQSCRLIKTTPRDLLYVPKLTKLDGGPRSVGEHVLRSAGVVEQTFGGITANLWDDPFEWTLPESLPTPALVIAYLNEVEHTRKRAFSCFAGDHDLLKKIAVPAGDMRPLADLLKETLERARGFQAGAAALLAALSNS
jgi:hypothetical protein